MNTDLKDMYQNKAEELALEDYDSEFYDLLDDTRLIVYNLAIEQVHDNLAAQADLRRKDV